MRIAFAFHLDKAIAAMVHLLERLGPTEKVKLMKLIYIADRDHFIRHGYPITGSHQVAMDYGPVSSQCLGALDGVPQDEAEFVFRAIHIENNIVSLKPRETEVTALTPQEIRTLDDVVMRYGSTPTWELVRQTHEFPEYAEVFAEGTSTRITYEAMLKHYGGDQGYRHNRPVISEAIQSRMSPPFTPGTDADL